MKYLSWKEETISDFSVNNIADMYEKGFVFTRIGKGVMQQTRSLRIDLNQFELSSENRRILKKVPSLEMKQVDLPLPSSQYNFSIGKMAKDFYDTKFGSGIMSAQKVKEMLTDPDKSNFNQLLKFQNVQSHRDVPHSNPQKSEICNGYTITYSSPTILHYSYPFYDLNNCPKDMGLAMMVTAVQKAKEMGLKYVYLGSLQRPTDVYKLQFSGLQWFDGNRWSTDLAEAKKILAS